MNNRRPGSANGQAVRIASLVLLNGAPGVGKSSVARRFADRRPGTLVVEIDAVRTAIGGWERHEESRLQARALAAAMAETHLSAGHSVIVPQYLGRPEFVDELAALAARCGARFVHVVLTTRPAVAAARFRTRRRDSTTDHPEADVDDGDIDALIRDAHDRLQHLIQRWPDLVELDAGAGVEPVARALHDLIEG